MGSYGAARYPKDQGRTVTDGTACYQLKRRASRNQTELSTVGGSLATSFHVEKVLLTDIDSALGRNGASGTYQRAGYT